MPYTISMLLEQERTLIVEYGRKLLEAQLTTGTGGNLSIFNRREWMIAIKPSGVDYKTMRPEDVVVVNPKGAIVEGKLRPSSELRLHLDLYNYRADINAVLHTHQVFATTLACLNWELPAVHYMVAFSGNKVPLAGYAAFGTQELSDNVVRSIGMYNACLMANHGIVTVGHTLPYAFATAEELELVARIYIQARSVGSPAILTDEEIDVITRRFGTYDPS